MKVKLLNQSKARTAEELGKIADQLCAHIMSATNDVLDNEDKHSEDVVNHAWVAQDDCKQLRRAVNQVNQLVQFLLEKQQAGEYNYDVPQRFEVPIKYLEAITIMIDKCAFIDNDEAFMIADELTTYHQALRWYYQPNDPRYTHQAIGAKLQRFAERILLQA